MALNNKEKIARREKREKGAKVKKYLEYKNNLDIIRSNLTLLEWEVLSKANKAGQDIWGKNFMVSKLATDMNMSYAKVKRCLALDKATEKSWQLLKSKKITAFKLAVVCQSESKRPQDDIIKEVIKKKTVFEEEESLIGLDKLHNKIGAYLKKNGKIL